jgi:aspartyl-tRNA(Asn)/glutamyl-tRNA(Gln) amidotransferase subunit B
MSDQNELSSTATKTIFLELFDPKNQDKPPRTLAKELNLLQENDTAALDQIIDEVLALPETQSAIADFKSGEQKALGFLIGQIMKHSAGKANPTPAQQLLRKKLS